jgi:diguanylate cyclase (GGDEF)-like protein
MNALETFQKALRDLADRYGQELPTKLAEIEGIWQVVREGAYKRDALAGLQQLVHGLDVSASMLGAPGLSEPARQLSRLLRVIVARDGEPSAEEAEHVETLLADLHRAASPGVIGTRFDQMISSYPRYVRDEIARFVYLLDDNPDSAASLATQLERFGYEVQHMDNTEQLVESMARAKPFAILADVEGSSSGLMALHAFGRLSKASPDRPPFIVMSSRNDVPARVEAVRAGALAYFTKPVRVPELVDKLDRLVTWEAPEPYRVLVIDRDRARSEFCRAILKEAGMDVACCLDPDDLMNILSDFNPEVVLAALRLNGYSGEELAQVIHQVPSFVSVPVVFLTENWQLEQQIYLMNLGGDAVLPAPVEPWQLISTLISRVERYRTLSALMQQDSLTGLLNHSRLQQYLEIETLRAQRQHHPLSLAMVDIDSFKEVNDQYGHPVGDRVLKNLSRFLRQNLRKSDIVGRYGGEEFAVILTDTDGAAAMSVMEKLCADFAQVEHDGERGKFRVTFSAGVASLSGLVSSRELVLAADRALYQAKHQGRNRVVYWQEASPAP